MYRYQLVGDTSAAIANLRVCCLTCACFLRVARIVEPDCRRRYISLRLRAISTEKCRGMLEEERNKATEQQQTDSRRLLFCVFLTTAGTAKRPKTDPLNATNPPSGVRYAFCRSVMRQAVSMVSTSPKPSSESSTTASAPLSQDEFNAYVQSTYGRYPLTIVRGEGCKLFDSNGKVRYYRYLLYVAASRARLQQQLSAVRPWNHHM